MTTLQPQEGEGRRVPERQLDPKMLVEALEGFLKESVQNPHAQMGAKERKCGLPGNGSLHIIKSFHGKGSILEYRVFLNGSRVSINENGQFSNIPPEGRSAKLLSEYLAPEQIENLRVNIIQAIADATRLEEERDANFRQQALAEIHESVKSILGYTSAEEESN